MPGVAAGELGDLALRCRVRDSPRTVPDRGDLDRLARENLLRLVVNRDRATPPAMDRSKDDSSRLADTAEARSNTVTDSRIDSRGASRRGFIAGTAASMVGVAGATLLKSADGLRGR